MIKFFNILVLLSLFLASCKEESSYDKFQEVTSPKVMAWVRYEKLLLVVVLPMKFPLIEKLIVFPSSGWLLCPGAVSVSVAVRFIWSFL